MSALRLKQHLKCADGAGVNTSPAASRPDPFAPIVNILCVSNSPNPSVSAALAEFSDVTAVESVKQAQDVVSARSFHAVTDVVVIDGAPADAPTLTAVRELRRKGCRVLLVSARTDELAVRAALQYGAHGYVVSRSARAGGRAVDARAAELSERELAVLEAVADGASNTEVGQKLGISALTVKSHLARIGHKLNTGDRAAMVARVLRAGLIS